MAVIGQVLTAPEAGWRRYDDTHQDIVYKGSWNHPPYAWATNGSYSWGSNSAINATRAIFSFTGTKIRIIGKTLENSSYSSNMYINIDGVEYTISILGANENTQKLLFNIENLPDKKHNAYIFSKDNLNFGFDSFDIDENSYFGTPLNKTLIQLSNGDVKYWDIKNLIPAMTSNSLPSGIVSASSINSATYDSWKAFDGDVTTQGNAWLATSGLTSGWVQYDYGIGKSERINSYSITGQISSNNAQDRSPKDWTFEGSNDNGATWVTLDTRVNVKDWIQNEMKYFSFENNLSYRMYKINIISNNGHATLLAIGEMRFHHNIGWKTLTTSIPTKSQFDTYGYDDLSVITSEQWADLFAIDSNAKLVTYVPEGNTSTYFDSTSTGKGVNMTALPHGQVSIQKEAFISKGGVEKVILESISKDDKPQGVIKVAFSEDDGTNWRVFKNGGWNRIQNVDKSELKQNGMTLDEIKLIPPNNLLSLTGSSEMISIAYYIEEDVRERDSSIVKSVTLSQDAVLGTPYIKDMAMSILNTKSTINLQLLGTNLIGTVDDIDKTKVRYRAFLNGVPYYPASGEFTQLMPSPANISLNIYSRDIKLGEENILRVEFEDSWGATDFKEIPFIGDYVGLIFKDPKGEAYSTELGELLKYLDIGTLIAGQVSNEYEIQIHNSLGYDVINPMVKGYTEQKGIEIELSKTTNPFQSEETVTWDKTMKSGETLSFYMRIATKYTTPPKMGADFSVRVYATKI